MSNNALIQAGNQILSQNKFPDSEELSLAISNTTTGTNLVLLGLASQNAQAFAKTLSFMNYLEDSLFTPETLEGLDFNQRMAILQENRKSAIFRHKFNMDVQEKVKPESLQVDMLKNDSKVRPTTGIAKDNLKVIREKLTHTVTKSYTVSGKQTSSPTNEDEVFTEYEEVT